LAAPRVPARAASGQRVVAAVEVDAGMGAKKRTIVLF